MRIRLRYQRARIIEISSENYETWCHSLTLPFSSFVRMMEMWCHEADGDAGDEGEGGEQLMEMMKIS